MYVVLFCVGLYWVFLWLSNLYLTVFIALIYTLSYIDGKEYTGERHWVQFRRWSLWKWVTPIRYTIENPTELATATRDSKRMYVVVPGDTLMSAFWGIGLHGGSLDESYASRLHYIVPPLLMWIPVLRDVLLWSGAVTWHHKKHPLNTLIKDLLQQRRSICYCPAQFTNGLVPVASGNEHLILERSHKDDPDPLHIPIPRLDDEMLEFMRAEAVELVPITISCERQRYSIARWSWLQHIQRFSMKHIAGGGYPLPFIFWLRMCGRKKPPPIQLQIGSVIACGRYTKSNEDLRRSFQCAVEGMPCTDVDAEQFVFDVVVSSAD